MERKEFCIETFQRGEYLGAFADHLALLGWGSREGKGRTHNYRFTFSDLEKISVRIVREDMGFPFGCTYDVTIEGPRPQIRKFVEQAKKNHEYLTHSIKVCDEQFKEVKKYDGLIKVVKKDEIFKDFVGRPVIVFEYNHSNKVGRLAKPTEFDIGYLKDLKFTSREESSFWIVNGVCLATKDSKHWIQPIHEICDIKYGYVGSSGDIALGHDQDKFDFYALDSDKTLVEVIERIQDGRSVSIS
ncbi:hypothetical protein J4423_01875 [Candidatus Pacearchaeota archaeon]|nr:hypothetical protein [Candidatus Pacearchaeota archaeon]